MQARAGLAGIVIAAAALSMGACASQPRLPRLPASLPAGSGWVYEIVAEENARELAVIVRFPQGTEAALSVDDQATRFLREVQVSQENRWATVVPVNGVWTVTECPRGCTVRYRFFLEEAANA